MEDVWKIIIILAPLAIYLIKAVNKTLKTEPASDAPNQNPLPPRKGPDTIPLPEAWRGLPPLDEVSRPKPLEAPVQTLSRQSLSKQHEARNSPSLTPAPRKSPARQVIAPPATPSPLKAHTADTDDFALRSAEEARKAIVWGEILQRKY